VGKVDRVLLHGGTTKTGGADASEKAEMGSAMAVVGDNNGNGPRGVCW
jgi:hypothetical protein